MAKKSYLKPSKGLIVLGILILIVVVAYVAYAYSSSCDKNSDENYVSYSNPDLKCKFGFDIEQQSKFVKSLPETMMQCSQDSDCCSGKCVQKAGQAIRLCAPSDQDEMMLRVYNAPTKYPKTQQTGDVCVNNDNCASGVCANNHCQPCLLVNKPCNTNLDCCSNNCSVGSGMVEKRCQEVTNFHDKSVDEQTYTKALENLKLYNKWDKKSVPFQEFVGEGKSGDRFWRYDYDNPDTVIRRINQVAKCRLGDTYSPCVDDGDCKSNSCNMTSNRCNPGTLDPNFTPCVQPPTLPPQCKTDSDCDPGGQCLDLKKINKSSGDHSSYTDDNPSSLTGRKYCVNPWKVQAPSYMYDIVGQTRPPFAHSAVDCVGLNVTKQYQDTQCGGGNSDMERKFWDEYRAVLSNSIKDENRQGGQVCVKDKQCASKKCDRFWCAPTSPPPPTPSPCDTCIKTNCWGMKEPNLSKCTKRVKAAGGLCSSQCK